ncbi:hypothetical protein D3C75_897340 [compost metagenome]
MDNGSTIRNRMVRWLAPSILADSSRLSGIAWKEVRIIIRLKVLTANGMMVAHKESIRPAPLTTRYNGTRPPWKNIVNTIRIVNMLFHITPLRDNTYAAIAVRSRFSETPATRMNSVLP